MVCWPGNHNDYTCHCSEITTSAASPTVTISHQPPPPSAMAAPQDLNLMRSFDFLLETDSPEGDSWQTTYVKHEPLPSHSEHEIFVKVEHSVDDPISNDIYSEEELPSPFSSHISRPEEIQVSNSTIRHVVTEEAVTYQLLSAKHEVMERVHTEPREMPSTSSATSTSSPAVSAGVPRPSAPQAGLSLLDVPCPKFASLVARRLLDPDQEGGPLVAISAAAVDHNASLNNDIAYGSNHEALALTRPGVSHHGQPRHSSASPHSVSPHHRTDTPHQYAVQLHHHPALPHHHSGPHLHAASPNLHVDSTHLHVDSTHLHAASPPHHADSPHNHADSPHPHADSPQHLADSPQHHASFPYHHSVLPHHHHSGFYDSRNYSALTLHRQLPSHQVNHYTEQREQVVIPPSTSPATQQQYSPSEHLVSSSSGSPTERPQNLSLVPSAEHHRSRYSGALPNFERGRNKSGSQPPSPGPSGKLPPLTFGSPRRSGSKGATTPSLVNGSSFQPYSSSRPQAYFGPPDAHGGSYSTFSGDSGFSQYLSQGAYPPVSHQQGQLTALHPSGSNVAGYSYMSTPQLPPFPTLTAPQIQAPQAFNGSSGAGSQGLLMNSGAVVRHHGPSTHVRSPTSRIFGPDREATCSECGVRFASSGHLKRHKQSHGSGRRFKCDHCNCAYSRQDNLRKHLANAHASKLQQPPSSRA